MTGGDREKLARETWQAYHAYTRGPDPDIEGDRVLFYTFADIAIAYADQRVAEAIQAERDRYVSGSRHADQGKLVMPGALSPAREGGTGDE